MLGVTFDTPARGLVECSRKCCPDMLQSLGSAPRGQQARLRTSFRLRKSKAGPAERSERDEEDDRDERIRREVEALVGHPIFDQDGPEPD